MSNIVILRSEEFASIDELHQLLMERLALPGYYGKNLDALWDCLTGWIKLPTTILWLGYENSARKVGPCAEKVAEVFREAEREVEGFTFIRY
ncbi:MAG: barstar family protein [Peptococcaceae bacterium]|nr:barstar family protein [Peptococcaceae bacterium]